MTGPDVPRWIRWSRVALVVLGTAVIVYAVLGAVTDNTVRLAGHATFLIAVLLTHDGIVMPAAIGIGVLIGRLVPASVRAVIRATAFVSGAVVVVALPFVLGFGALPDEPSALPLDYGRGLLVTLAAVWLAAAATIAWRLLPAHQANAADQARKGG